MSRISNASGALSLPDWDPRTNTDVDENKYSPVELSRWFQENGLRIGNFNWPYLIDKNVSEGCQNSRLATEEWLDIPVHQNLSIEDIMMIKEKFSEKRA